MTTENFNPLDRNKLEDKDLGRAEGVLEKTREQIKFEFQLNKNIEEAKERNISPQQWEDLLHVAKANSKNKKWINRQFNFLGNGKIEAEDSDLYLNNCTSLTHLPENLKIRWHLYLNNCTSLTHLPENLKIEGGLNLNNCTSLTYIPENLKVGCGLLLNNCTSLTHLPENLKIEGDLDLKNCTSLTHLPENLKVRGYLDLTSCTSLTHLPENLKVRGYLDLTSCTSLIKNKEKVLPKLWELVNGGNIKNLYLSGWPITDDDLPVNLKVDNNLRLASCKLLTHLPEYLEVEDDLHLENCTSLTHLPENINVGGYLFLSENLSQQVKDDAKRLKGEEKILRIKYL